MEKTRFSIIASVKNFFNAFVGLKEIDENSKRHKSSDISDNTKQIELDSYISSQNIVKYDNSDSKFKVTDTDKNKTYTREPRNFKSEKELDYDEREQ